MATHSGDIGLLRDGRRKLKLFRTNCIDVVKDCDYYFGCGMPSRLIKNKLDKFILRYITVWKMSSVNTVEL